MIDVAVGWSMFVIVFMLGLIVGFTVRCWTKEEKMSTTSKSNSFKCNKCNLENNAYEGCAHSIPRTEGRYRCAIKTTHSTGVVTTIYNSIIYKDGWLLPEPNSEVLRWTLINP